MLSEKQFATLLAALPFLVVAVPFLLYYVSGEVQKYLSRRVK